ncbi:MAG: DUF1449 family protein [Elainellaceae cyanobacterium]
MGVGFIGIHYPLPITHYRLPQMPLFDFSNLPYWLLLGMGVLLFLSVIVSGGGDDDLDVDADADLDADLDADADVDTDAAGGFSVARSLDWLGFGKAPLILLLATDLSLWGILGWLLNVSLGSSLGALLGGFVGGVIFFTSLVISLLLGGQIAKPVGKVFASFGEDASSDRLVGCLGTVSTARIPTLMEGKIGQVDVLDAARNRVTVNAMLPDWATVIPQRGDKVLVIERSPQGYVVIVHDSPDQDQWFSSQTKHSR